MDFASLVSALKTNKADIVLAGMTPTEKRKSKLISLMFITMLKTWLYQRNLAVLRQRKI